MNINFFSRANRKPLSLSRLEEKRSDRRYYLLAFFLPMLVLELVSATYQVYPFGDNSLLVLDLNAQYIYYYESFRDAFWGKASFIYSWSRTLGGEMFGLNAYYTSSPFMIIYALLPKKFITEALLLTTLLKSGCASLSFAWYLKKSRGGGGYRGVIFGVLYGLMGYMVVQQMDPMWLDAVIGLPIIMYGVERLIKEGKFILYTVSLTLVFIANFYIGYMVAIFTLAYFFFAYFTTCEYGPGNARRFFRAFFKFGFFSVLSALMSAFVLIPTYYSLSLGKLDFTNPSYAVRSKFDFFDAIPKFLFGTYDTCRPEGLPTLYIGTLSLIMMPLFFANKHVDVRRKIGGAALMFFLFMSMSVSAVDLIWHGFQNPNWLNYRYSFCLSAIMLVFAFEAFNRPDGYTTGNVAGAAGLWVLLTILVQKAGFEYIDIRITVWAGLFLIVVFFGFVVADAARGGKVSKRFLIALLAAVCVEAYFNGLITRKEIDEDVVYSNRQGREYSYRNFVDKYYAAAQALRKYDDSFYRTEKTYTRTVNDAMALGTYGVSHSSSTLNADAVNYVDKLGYYTGGHWTRFIAPIPTVDALVGIKYILQKNSKDYGLDYIFSTGDPEAGTAVYVYENPLALPVCYPTYEDYINFDFKEYENPFDEQNALLSALFGYDEIVEFYKPYRYEYMLDENIETKKYGLGYTKYYPEVEGRDTTLSYIIKGNGYPLYAAFPSRYYRKVNIWIDRDFYYTYQDGNEGGLIALGRIAEGDTVECRITVLTEVYLKNEYVYYLDTELVSSAFARLQSRVSEVEKLSETKLKMTVTMDGDQVLYTSIPYERGWHAYVDGVKLETYRNELGLLTFDVGAGTHEIVLKFLPNYYIRALLISFGGLALFILSIYLSRLIKKKGWRLPTLSELLMLGYEGEYEADETDAQAGESRSGGADDA